MLTFGWFVVGVPARFSKPCRFKLSVKNLKNHTYKVLETLQECGICY